MTQETFIRAYHKLEPFRGQSGLYDWLYRIALNLSINNLRKKKLRSMIGLEAAPQSELAAPRGDPEADLRDARTRERIELAVGELPPRQRAILVLRQYDGLSHAEIASVVGSSEWAVRAGYFHALRKLRIALGDLVEPTGEGIEGSSHGEMQR